MYIFNIYIPCQKYFEKSENSEKYEKYKKSEIDIYIDNLNPLEKIAYEIAKSRLKTSFDIEKSIGYIKK